jgi:hypothetical protein
MISYFFQKEIYSTETGQFYEHLFTLLLKKIRIRYMNRSIKNRLGLFGGDFVFDTATKKVLVFFYMLKSPGQYVGVLLDNFKDSPGVFSKAELIEALRSFKKRGPHHSLVCATDAGLYQDIFRSYGASSFYKKSWFQKVFQVCAQQIRGSNLFTTEQFLAEHRRACPSKKQKSPRTSANTRKKPMSN